MRLSDRLVSFTDDAIDGDNSEHILWLFEKAQERANEYGIQGVTYRLTQGMMYICVKKHHTLLTLF